MTGIAPQTISLVNRALSLVYPEVCQICEQRRATAAEGYVCGDCRNGVQLIQEPFCERCGMPFNGAISAPFECSNCRELELHFDSARSAVRAQGVVLEVIHRYKYQHALWFEPFLADLLIRQAMPALRASGCDVVIPVPLHAVREREREFNQARRLANRLGVALGLPVRAGWLQRVRPTATQTLLSRKERAANMRHAFGTRAGVRVEGLSCVLVDDVLTTGATTSACAQALKGAGARSVCVWTVARGV